MVGREMKIIYRGYYIIGFLIWRNLKVWWFKMMFIEKLCIIYWYFYICLMDLNLNY